MTPICTYLKELIVRGENNKSDITFAQYGKLHRFFQQAVLTLGEGSLVQKNNGESLIFAEKKEECFNSSSRNN